MQAGTLPRADFMENNQFNEKVFGEIRERKLANLLATEVMESEDQWLRYEFEHSQINQDLSDLIFDHLMTETATILSEINEPTHKKSLFSNVSFTDKLKVYVETEIEEILSD